MKVLILNASPRKKGKVASILAAVADGARDTHEVEWVDIYGLSIKPCLSCMKCRPDRPCALPADDGHAVAGKIAAADVLVVGTPTYWGNMSAPLKALFDRSVTTFERLGLTGLPRPLHRGKKAVIVTASSAPWPYNLLPSQAAGAVRCVRTVLTGGGFRVAGVVILGSTRNMAQVPPRVLRRAERIGRAL
jgi:multimeric flavodoxin WrbA